MTGDWEHYLMILSHFRGVGTVANCAYGVVKPVRPSLCPSVGTYQRGSNWTDFGVM